MKGAGIPESRNSPNNIQLSKRIPKKIGKHRISPFNLLRYNPIKDVYGDLLCLNKTVDISGNESDAVEGEGSKKNNVKDKIGGRVGTNSKPQVTNYK